MKTSILRSDDQLNTAHFISVTPMTIAVFNYFYAHFDISYSKNAGWNDKNTKNAHKKNVQYIEDIHL